jgi:putative addiction module CopG family antidote
MDDNSISISVSADERAFIDRQLAAGRYASEEELLRAGLAALERQSLTPGGFGEADDLAPFISEDVDSLRRDLAASLASGVSRRHVRDIMGDVKVKLRANGTL